MSKLTGKERAHLKPSSFALPGNKYPIENPSHARNALARVSQFGSPSQKAQVRNKVAQKYPSIAQHISKVTEK